MARHILLDVKVPKANARARTWARWFEIEPNLEEVHSDQDRNWY
jgi:hypothetical protein